MAGVGRFEDLIAWQLCAAFRDRILKLTEGFGAFYPREFARFGRIARRSIIETRNHLLDARERKYFPEEEIKQLIHLTFRAQKATTRLIKYLESCKGRPPNGWNFKG